MQLPQSQRELSRADLFFPLVDDPLFLIDAHLFFFWNVPKNVRKNPTERSFLQMAARSASEDDFRAERARRGKTTRVFRAERARGDKITAPRAAPHKIFARSAFDKMIFPRGARK